MNPQPKNVTVPLAAIVLFAVMAVAPPARAGTPDVPPAGMGAYIVVLKDPALVPAGETPVPFEDGEIGRLGGRLVASHANMREVLLPLAEAKRLREHPAVAYVQRMWMGEPLDRWVDDESPGTPRRRIRTLQENDLTWTTGTYRYDGSGNIRQIGADTYGYDSAGRLSRAAVNGMIETYRYDSFGNLLEKNLAGRPASVPVDPMSNRVTGESYDAAGNLLTREGQPSFVYDSMGMVVTSTVQRPNAPATTRRHLYDADDERLGTVIDANLVRWTIRDFGGRVLREYESNNDRQFSPWWWTEDYVYAEGKLVAGAREPFYGGERHFHLDHLGSVRLVTHGNDLAASRHDYYPFGTEQTSVVQEYVNLGLFPNPEPMKFTGHERDYRGYLNVDNTDYLDYMHARYYDPKMGRFLSVDPYLNIDKTMRNPQMWNRYAYVMNNPLRYTDPTGKSFWSVLGRGAIDVVSYVGRDEKLVARIVATNKRETMDATRAAIRQAKKEGATSVAVVTPTDRRAQAVARDLSDNGKARGPERSPNWPKHYNPETGEFADVHVQTVAATKRAGLGKSLIAIIGATTLATTADADATPGEIISAVIWDTAKALDPIFVTDAIEYATGLNEFTQPPPEP